MEHFHRVLTKAGNWQVFASIWRMLRRISELLIRAEHIKLIQLWIAAVCRYCR